MDGTDDQVSLLPLWGTDCLLLSVILECIPPQVVVAALKFLDSVPLGVKSYVDVVAGILRVLASISSGIAMRFAIQHYLQEDREAQQQLMPSLLRYLHCDVTLQGAAMPLINHLLMVSRAGSSDCVNVTLLYLTARLRMRIFPASSRATA